MFLSDGRELPTLHFHDGGSTGLLHALQRYVFLNRYNVYVIVYVRKRRREREKGKERWVRKKGTWMLLSTTCVN